MKHVLKGALQMIKNFVLSYIPASYTQTKTRASFAQKSIIERASSKSDNAVYAKINTKISDINKHRKKDD